MIDFRQSLRATALLAAGVIFMPAAARAADCAPQHLASIKTAALADGRVVLPVTVQDHSLSFLLDTGGASTTVKWELARDMKLPVIQTERRLNGVGGSSLNFALTGDNFSLGGLRVKNKPIYVETRPLPDADGTLGPDILRDYDVGIDMAGGAIDLFSTGYCAAPEWTQSHGGVLAIDVTPSGHVRLPVKLDGANVAGVLDTGSVISVMGLRLAALLGIYPNSPGVELVRDTGEYRIYSYRFQALEIGGVTVKNPRIAIATDGFVPDDDLVLGADALRQMRLTIAYGSRRLYIRGPQEN